MLELTRHINTNWSSLKGKHLYVACSGGLDSMVLLHLLVKNSFSVSVIHVNYQLRGEDSHLDSQLVEATCKSLNVPFEVRKINLAEQLEQSGNLQEEARNFRYHWFNEILNHDENNRISLAHHADDQVETFFLNLARKSGVMGLSCMKSEHNGIIRPLLNFAKKELLHFAVANQILWREDLSNESAKYSRNRLRNEIIPLVRAEIPSLDSSVLTLINSFQKLQLELEETVANLISEIELHHSLALSAYNALNSFERIELFRQMGISAKMAISIEKISTSNKGKHVDINHKKYTAIIRDHDQFTFLTESKLESVLVQISVKKLPDLFSKTEIFLDASKLNGTLNLRRWKLEDIIAPIGMTGSQLVSDIIKDAKLTTQEKNEVLIVHDKENIHWCVGLKIGRKALAHKSSKEIIKCEISD